jgi:hypothetical protein
MLFRILKNTHRALPFPIGLHFGKNYADRLVKFSTSCAYNLGGTDQYDINKLYGVGYFPGHHTNSARYGWRYDDYTGRIELYAYCYINGKRLARGLCRMRLNKWYRLFIYISSTHYYFSVVDNANQETIAETRIEKGHNNKISYSLGAYFGGNRKAPHTMKIRMQKI